MKNKNMQYKILENSDVKKLLSDNYNYVFNKKTGFFARWGATEDEDPQFSPFGPEIADIEITTICNRGCKYCYKSNTGSGEYMSFDNFKKLFNKFPRTLTQIAMGADDTLKSNPDIWKIMDYCRNNDYQYIVPNVTVAEVDDQTADNLAKYCGAVAVSRHLNKEVCYDSVKKLTDRGMKQINIHFVISSETFDRCMETLGDIKTDERLKGLNCIVLLSLKQKGRGTTFKQLTREEFNQVVLRCNELKINYGFDSCSANKFVNLVVESDTFLNKKELLMAAESCESSLHSMYCNVRGYFSPCSFIDKTPGWEVGIDVLNCSDFMKDVWYNESVIKWRHDILNTLDINGQRRCPIYTI